MSCQDCEKHVEKCKSVAVMIQFDSTRMISVVVEDSDSNAKELSEIAEKLVFDIAERFNKKR